MWIVSDKLLSESLHDSVNNLSLSRKPEACQNSFKGSNKLNPFQIILVNELHETSFI